MKIALVGALCALVPFSSYAAAANSVSAGANLIGRGLVSVAATPVAPVTTCTPTPPAIICLMIPAGTASANTPVATLIANTIPKGQFTTGSFSKSGTDAALFVLGPNCAPVSAAGPCQLLVGPADLAPKDVPGYQLTISATQP